MELDDHVCLCFHVTKRKVLSFIRIEKPKRVAQISECQGAGTGCGWCRPFLKRMFDQGTEVAAKKRADKKPDPVAEELDLESMSAQQYAAFRSRYVKEGGGTPPPGATPVEDSP